MRNFLMFVIILLFAFTSIFSIESMGLAKSGLEKSEREFIKEIKKNKFYKEYQNELLNKQPKLLNPAYDYEGNQIGYVAQYELEYGHSVNDEIKFTSLLTFIFDSTSNKLEVGIVDYSDLLDRKIHFIDLNTREIHSLDVEDNEIYESFVNHVESGLIEHKNNLKESSTVETANLIDSRDHDEMKTNSEICWFCTQYESDGGYWHSQCQVLVGTACLWADKLPYGRVICAFSLVVGCYVPQYQYCVNGFWSEICPLP